jgi:hypothetical protein
MMPPNTDRPNIELHIEELVLDGFAPGDRQRIGAAVQHELARLLAERGAPPGWEQGGAGARMGAGTMRLTAGAKPEAIGAQVARAVYGGPPR